jgi:hypothetical protein
MNNDDERDYAEERANLADMRREQEGEAAHEALVGRVVSALRHLSTETHNDARASVVSLAREVELRLAPNVHRYELLARQQHLALLAATAAAAVEEAPGYDLLAAAQGVAEAYVATHRIPGNGDDRLATALGDAVTRALGVVQSVLDTEEQREQDARDAADHAETEAYLLRVTR